MLRPAVAATNCARAGETSGLDIGRRRLSVEETRNSRARRGRCRKVPGQEEAVNEVRKTALSPGDSRGFGGTKGAPPKRRVRTEILASTGHKTTQKAGFFS